MTPSEIIAFWFDDIGPKGWFNGGDAVDGLCRDSFGGALAHAAAGGYGPWLTSAEGSLGYIVLIDQLSRNIFRNDPRAFAADLLARSAAKSAIARGWDTEVEDRFRPFFYLPLEHSELMADQTYAVDLIAARITDPESTALVHAKAHAEAIRRFGRFPWRNAALGRENTPEEAAVLEAGGYGVVLKEVQADRAGN